MKFKNFNKLKRILINGFIISGAITTLPLITGCSSSFDKMKDEMIEKGVVLTDNAYLGSFDTENKNYDFSLADCGNYHIGFDTKAEELLNNETLPTGIIIKSTVSSKIQMYKEIDYVKNIIMNYPIDYPIFLNVDYLMLANNNNIELVKELVNIFISKLETNGCIVNLIGTNNNLNVLYAMDEYDDKKMIYIDDNSTKADIGAYDMGMTNNMIFIDNMLNYNSFIDEFGFNLSNRFINDFTYITKEGDTLEKLSEKYNLSVSDICEYNNISEYDITNLGVGRVLIFPNIYEKEKIKVLN